MSQEPLPSPSIADQSFEHEALPLTSSKVWLLTDGLSPLAVSLTRRLLENGDCVIAGIAPEDFSSPRATFLKELLHECDGQSGNQFDEDLDESDRPWKERLKLVNLDIRYTAQIQAGVAEALDAFGQIDVLLLCRSEGME
jgi:NAD(P)-dependent dehydrogenase (short-subunit alcohol dehydrogenase family)